MGAGNGGGDRCRTGRDRHGHPTGPDGYAFTIFDGAGGFGGTWRKNTYPGAACDVPSHFYSFSFALNPRWSKTYANQPEILAYLERVAAEGGLGEHLCANTRVTSLRWSDTDQRWTVTTDDGGQHEFEVVVSAVGMLDVPSIPVVAGADRFRGRTFHSSEWDHSTSLVGQRVASIGTGASAVQYVPEIAAQAEHLVVFQRTPIWVSPRFDEPFSAEQQEVFERDPLEALKMRDAALEQYEQMDFDEGAEQTAQATDRAVNTSAARSPTRSYGPSSRPPTRSAASGRCSRAPGFRRSPGRTSPWRPRRSSNSPPTVCARPTASSTSPTPSSTAPASRRRTTSAASTSTAVPASGCTTTGVTAPRRIWGR